MADQKIVVIWVPALRNFSQRIECPYGADIFRIQKGSRVGNWLKLRATAPADEADHNVFRTFHVKVEGDVLPHNPRPNKAHLGGVDEYDIWEEDPPEYQGIPKLHYRDDATDELGRAKVVVISLTKTSPACPAQWEGIAADGRVIYIRYRGGVFAVHVGDTIDEALDAGPIQCERVGATGWEGMMGDDEMMRLARASLDFDL
jgi:hypothetical protein